MFVCVCHFVLAIFYRESCLAFSHTKMYVHTHTHTHTLAHTHTACSVTRRKETQGEAAHLTGIQLSVSNGGHPGEEEGEADLQWWRRAEGNFLRELVLSLSLPLHLPQLNITVKMNALSDGSDHMTLHLFCISSKSMFAQFSLFLILRWSLPSMLN